ncbi:MAG: AAA family ATPase [Geminicoccaceae bacterium]|nr:AAA family ATPase [Geminicoccaceae bacterium]
MYLRRLELYDFKAFELAKFEFPPPRPNKNVILIGGRNGFGKTTLFEALAIGLFGRDGIRLVARARPGAEPTDRAETFARFMERALFAEALARGRSRCRIVSIFQDEEGEPIEIYRTWHFSDSGHLRPRGEEVHIVRGWKREVVAPPADDTDPDAWYREWIFRTFMPVNQVAFFCSTARKSLRTPSARPGNKCAKYWTAYSV